MLRDPPVLFRQAWTQDVSGLREAEQILHLSDVRILFAKS